MLVNTVSRLPLKFLNQLVKKVSSPSSELVTVAIMLSNITQVDFSSQSIKVNIPVWAGIAQSVQRPATYWTVWGFNPAGNAIFRTRPDRP